MFPSIFLIFANLSFSVARHPYLFETEASNVHTFPKDFSFGAATAAYQVEGGWNADGKGPSIWDTLTHEHPELIADHSTADVGADSYHFYKKDVEALKKVGVMTFTMNYEFHLLIRIIFVSVSSLSVLDFVVTNLSIWARGQPRCV